MRGGLATSVVLHAAILAWALFTIQAQRELRMPEAEPIAVDLVSPSELTRLRQGARDAKQLEAQPKEAPKAGPSKKEAPKPTPVAAAPPPPPPPPPKEEPKEEPTKEVASLPPPAPAPPPPPAVPPVPAPDEQEKLNALLKEQEREAEEQKKAEELKKIEEQKRLEAERKQAELKKKLDEEKRRKEAELKKKREDEKKRKEAEAKKKQFDAENIAALLNKVPDKGAPSQSPMPTEPTKAKGPVLGAPEGRDAQISASERAVLAQIIRACVQARWNLSAGGEDAMNTVIKLRLQFRPDGTLSVPPQVTNQQNTPYFLAASEGAVRAAQACEPYSLPTEKYEAWRDVLMTFSLRDMLR